MQLSADFSWEEMTATQVRSMIQQNQDQARDPNIMQNLTRLANELLQPIRDAIAAPILINSGFRCGDLNRIVGGVPTSEHTQGFAADIHCNALPLRELAEHIRLSGIPFGQLILEMNSWIHVSLPGRFHGALLEAQWVAGGMVYNHVTQFL